MAFTRICTAVGQETIRPAAPHYNYDDLEDCPCFLCAGHRRLWSEAVAKRIALEANGNRFTEDVPPEMRYEVVSVEFLAHANRRDLYCELSYLTANKTWGAQLLKWILERIEDPSWKDDAWWAWRSQTRTLGQWIKEWYDTDPPCMDPA